nr:hypothetical protein B0A51_01680 [Rachicladosporium sp. CCFEE 5018]
MSSAAVQQSSTTQQYQQRERYAADPSANLPSKSPQSRRSGRPNDGTYGSPNPAAMSPARQQMSPSNPQDGMSNSTYEQYYPEQATPRGQTTALPVRTSQPPMQSSPAAYDSRGQPTRNTYDGTGGYSSQDDRDRRRNPRSPEQSPAAQPSSGRTQRTKQAPGQSRSQNAIGQPPMGTDLPRENSAIINRIVVDDPAVDIARERARVAEAQPHAPGSAGLGVVGNEGVPDAARASTGQRSRQEHLKTASTSRKEVKFGDYILGQTLGEGEFGKVKMGWKKEGGVQVAIKLIRKESLQGNTTRLPKIYREISILRELQHPNIVRLHEFVETERHMGIILEYASGGELFDYILNHRYLKDRSARRLFAQLVSGVGYLHRKGIVHRDLKLENLLLDRHKNIIITDFGFANTFDPADDLSEEQEHRITDKDFVKREGLDVQNKEGYRRGDLMQTSCGSPCYAAPELVVSDGLYTGRKVDVWSCGVILYAMLAGYLPFDDDPANPEGDNINLLYKYIVSTPLTFPEYVTPHARDLLRRILVPDPRKRADLFEVARHSWLSEFSHVVGFIGSSTKSDMDIAASALPLEQDDTPIGRSASVREPASRSAAVRAPPASGQTLPAADDGAARKARRDEKRNTVQLEYIAPNAAHPRGDTTSPEQSTPIAGAGRTRARADSQGPIEVQPTSARQPVPRKEVGSQSMLPPARPVRDQGRTGIETTSFVPAAINSASRPNTRGTLASRGNSYSQPAVAAPTNENVQGQFSQPKTGPGYIISSNNMSPVGQNPSGRPDSSNNLGQMQSPAQHLPPQNQRGHKRGSTFGSITDRVLGRSNSRRQSQTDPEQQRPMPEKRDRRHPPLSMKNAMPNTNEEATPRRSTDSRRSSFQFLRKNSSAPSEATGTDSRRNSRRFSFLPNSFSMNSFTGKGNKDANYAAGPDGIDTRTSARPASKGIAFGLGVSRSPSQSTQSTIPLYADDSQRQQSGRRPTQEKPLPGVPSVQQGGGYSATPPPIQRKQYRDDGYGSNVLDAAPLSQRPQASQQQQLGSNEPLERFYTPEQDPYPTSGAGNGRQTYGSTSQSQGYGAAPQQPYGQDGVAGNGAQNLRPGQRRFEQGYEKGNEGSSSGARRVMDFFRRRGKERGGA